MSIVLYTKAAGRLPFRKIRSLHRDNMGFRHWAKTTDGKQTNLTKDEYEAALNFVTAYCAENQEVAA